MVTLIEIKKESKLKNKDIAQAFSCSISKATMILQGRYIFVFSDEEIERLAKVLNITFERCWYAMQESYTEKFRQQAPEKRASERLFTTVEEMKLHFPDLKFFQKVPRLIETVDSYRAIDTFES